MTRHDPNVPPTEPPEGLDAFLTLAWEQLLIGARSARHAFHLPVLATTAPDGLPDARTVVLRQIDPASRQILAHTDTRSPKVEHLKHQPIACWLFYDPAMKLQVRAVGETRIETDTALAERRWEASDPSARRCYMGPFAPGSESELPSTNLPAALEHRVPTAQETLPGRERFAVVVTTVHRLDLLWLHHAGHRRAGYQWTEDGLDTPVASWLHP